MAFSLSDASGHVVLRPISSSSADTGGGTAFLATDVRCDGAELKHKQRMVSCTSLSRRAKEWVMTQLRSLFVPTGTLPPEYVAFQAADSIQAMCSYLRGILTLHSTLAGAATLAQTDEAPASGGAAALAATLALVVKEGSGMLASLAFTHMFAHVLDGEVRWWRLFADIINDVGLTLELLAPLGGARAFLPLSVCGNVCRSLCGVSAGAARTGISAHFAAVSGNIGEVAAKEGAQETAVSLAGLAAGALLAAYINASPSVAWTAFAVLTVLHVVANYWAVRILSLRTLNRSRWLTLLEHTHVRAPVDGARDDPIVPVQYMHTLQSMLSCCSCRSAGRMSKASPAWPRVAGCIVEPMRVRVGCALTDAIPSPDVPLVALLLGQAADADVQVMRSWQGSRAAVRALVIVRGSANSVRGYILLQKGATPDLVLSAYAAVQAWHLAASDGGCRTPSLEHFAKCLGTVEGFVVRTQRTLTCAKASGWDCTERGVLLGDELQRVQSWDVVPDRTDGSGGPSAQPPQRKDRRRHSAVRK